MSKLKPWQMRYSQYERDYHAFYHSKRRVHREDAELRRQLVGMLWKGDVVADYGCGDGLAKRMIRDSGMRTKVKYIGIDPDNTYVDVEVPWRLFQPDFVGTADEYLQRNGHEANVAVFLFSSEDAGWRTVCRAVDRAERALVTVRNKAWRTNAPLVENFVKHWLYYKWQSVLLLRALRRRGLHIEKLLGEEYYYVARK